METYDWQEQEDKHMERVEKFLKEAETYYLATVEGDQPRVRPFGTVHIFEGKLYQSSYTQIKRQKSVHLRMENGCVSRVNWLRTTE